MIQPQQASAAWAARVSVLALTFAGCASLPPEPTTVAGRLSLQVAAHAGTAARGFNAAFDLRGDAEIGSLHLSTPLGPQIAVAMWTPGEVRLQSSDGEHRFTSLAELSIGLLGEDLPLQALPDWLRGRPWPGAPQMPSGDGFSQIGWQLDLSRRDQGFITAIRSAPPVVTLRVRLEDAR